MNVLRLTLLVTLAALLAAGCAKKPVAPEVSSAIEQPPEEVIPAPDMAVAEAPMEKIVPQPEAEPELQRIHFDFDQYTLTPQARDILAETAAYLNSHPETKVTIEGYCDERGSDEYNLALGERRALAAKSYLVSLGVAPENLNTITYGEENPFASGHDEEAWAKSRRAEFNIVL